MSEKKPDLRGVLQDDNTDYRNRQTLGKIALWMRQSKGEKAPKYTGVLEIPNKGKFRITLWDNSKEEEKSSPFYTGAETCRYCKRSLTESDLLWNACNRCAYIHEGFIPPPW
jgi:hypothetical protein